MKKFMAAFMLCFVSILYVYSQEYMVENGKVFIEKVVPTEMTIAQAHDAMETYFADAYGDSNKTCKLNSPNHLVYVGLYTNLSLFCMVWRIHANHNIDILFKEGRCKIKIACDVADVTNGTYTLHYNIADFVPFTDHFNMSATSAPKSAVVKAANEMIIRMNNSISNIEETLKQKPMEAEDW